MRSCAVFIFLFLQLCCLLKDLISSLKVTCSTANCVGFFCHVLSVDKTVILFYFGIAWLLQYYVIKVCTLSYLARLCLLGFLQLLCSLSNIPARINDYCVWMHNTLQKLSLTCMLFSEKLDNYCFFVITLRNLLVFHVHVIIFHSAIVCTTEPSNSYLFHML